MTITMQPAVSVSSGSKFVISLVGQDLSGLLDVPLITDLSQTGFTNLISFVRVKPFTSSEVEFVFGSDVPANTVLSFSFGTFRHPDNGLPAIDALESAIIDPFGKVLAPSSSGSFPAVFTTPISGSSIEVSSLVANAANVSISLTFSPPNILSSLKLSGLGFVSFAGALNGRRLLQSGITCTNMAYSGTGALTASYDALDGNLLISFPGGKATRINQATPCSCQISGFRNPAAAVASPGFTVTTFDENGKGSGIQNSGLVFPSILCAFGYLQITAGNAVRCDPCPKGTYTDMPGATKCLECPSGTYGAIDAAPSLASCLPCPPATFSNQTGASDSSTCRNCPPGTNSSVSGASACMSCSAGSYAEASGQQFCDLCSAGSYGPQPRASSRSDCRLCSIGTFSTNGSALCTRCPPGSTSSVEGSSDCQPCPAGTYSDVGGECFKCPSISYSLTNGSTSVYDCSGIQIDIGGSNVAYNIGIIVLVIYILSFSLVPMWSAADAVMRFELTANFEGRAEKKSASSQFIRHSTTYMQKVVRRVSISTPSESRIEVEKRFFSTGDKIMWRQDEQTTHFIGTIESSSVYPEQDADKYGDFVAFIKMNPEFEQEKLDELSKPFGPSASNFPQPVLFNSEQTNECRCQLKKAPARFAHFPIFGFNIGRWEVVRQVNACFQLLLLSMFPAIDTISDLVYILSSLFANYYIFVASMFFFTVQFWVYVVRLKRRRVFQALRERHIKMDYLKGTSFWPKWASADSLPVIILMVVPFYFFFYVVFPIFWFFLGYAIYSFQLFPISRISNRWLYAFV